MQKLAKDALAVQDACNLSGVAHGFARHMSRLLQLTRSTEEANTHPVTIVWADKINHLAGIQPSTACPQVTEAYRQCHRLAEGLDPSKS